MDKVIAGLFVLVAMCSPVCAFHNVVDRRLRIKICQVCNGDLTLAGTSADVWDEASSAGVRLGGALLTGVAPCSANRGTAKGFRADDSTELALAHLVAHLGETWSCPIVCGQRGT